MPEHRDLRRYSLVIAALGTALSSVVSLMSWVYWSPGNAADLVANLGVLLAFIAFGVVAALDTPRRPLAS